jgi:sugar/nucleoside kinase (ribokinase family)
VRIVVVGDVVDDVLVRPTGPVRRDTDTVARIERRPGGSAANVAAWLGALGCQVDFVGTVNRRDVGRHTAELAVSGVRAHLAGSEEPTGSIVLLVEGESRTMFTARGANAETSPASVPGALLAGAAHLHLTGYSLFRSDPRRWQGLIAAARAAGLTTSVDPSSAAFLGDWGVAQFLPATEGVDVLFPNLDEGRLLSGREHPGDIADALAARYPVVALTLGPDGAEVRAPGVVGSVPAALPDGGLVDPTGAGDAFAAGFLSVWTGGGDPLDAARAGVRAATRAVSVVGARPLL